MMKFNTKAKKALETLRQETGVNWRSPNVWLVTYNARKKTFETASLAYKHWHSADVDTDDLDVVGIGIGHSREIISVAAMLGVLEFDPKKDFSLVFLPINLMDAQVSSTETINAAETIIEMMPVVFDERDENCSVKTVTNDKRSFWWRPEFKYCGNKEIPDDLAYVYCRNRFLDLIDTVWNNSFIIRPRIIKGRSKSVKAISRASTIANLLLLDRGNFDVFSKKGKCPQWQIKALKRIDITVNAFSPKMKDVFEEVSRLQDVAAFWCTAADYYGWALRLSTSDLEDGKIEETKKRIAMMAQLIDLESYLDAYDAGVPASDILA